MPEPTIRCIQDWIFWEKLRCVAHSILIVALTKAYLNFRRTSTLQTKCLLGNFACTQTLFNLSTKVNVNVLKTCPYVRSAKLTLKFKPIALSWCVTLHVFFWIDAKINSRLNWRVLLSSWAMFKAQVWLSSYKERYCWKLIRMSSMKRLLQHSVHSF